MGIDDQVIVTFLICDFYIFIEAKLVRLLFAESRRFILSSLLHLVVFGRLNHHVVEAPALSEVLFLADPLQVKER